MTHSNILEVLHGSTHQHAPPTLPPLCHPHLVAQVLQTILGLERLERMTNFAAELAGLQEGSQPGASWASSSLASSSVRAGSTASLGQGPSHSGGATSQAAVSGPAGDAGRAPAGLAAPPAAAAAAAAVGPRGGEAAEEEGSEAGSSRRWTEGSSVAADGQLPGAELAAALLELSLSGQHQPQAAEVAAQARPARMAQVSPHCPEAPPAATPGGGRQGAAEGGAAAADEEAASTPPERVQPTSMAAAVGPTPFFTPAGLSSALGTPAGHSRTAPWEQAAAAGRPDAAGGIRRALDDTLAEAEGSSTGSPEAPGQSAAAEAASPAADGAAGEGAGAEAAAAASEAASGSRPGSAQEPLQQQQQQPEFDDGSSDAESYLTASSSTALLAQQVAGLDASPATAAFLAGSARKAQHARSVSGTSLASVGPGGASPAPASMQLLDASEAEAAQQQEENGDAEDDAPALLQLLLDQGPQQASGRGSAAQPPLLDLDGEPEQQVGSAAAQQQPAAAAAEVSPGQQQQQQQPLMDVDGPNRDVAVNAAQQPAAAPAVQEQPAQLEGLGGGLLLEETPVKEQQLGSGVAVRIVRRSYSSPAQGHGVAGAAGEGGCVGGQGCAGQASFTPAGMVSSKQVHVSVRDTTPPHGSRAPLQTRRLAPTCLPVVLCRAALATRSTCHPP